jgi:hypothetical protein
VGDLADEPVGDGHHDDISLSERTVKIDTIDANDRLQALTALFRDLDMVDLEARALQVGSKADAHLASGPKQRNFRHFTLLLLPG